MMPTLSPLATKLESWRLSVFSGSINRTCAYIHRVRFFSVGYVNLTTNTTTTIMLSHLFPVEGLKLVEVDKCRKELNEIKTQIFDTQKKMVDYSRLR